ncbi:M67 family metallopeptidase [Paenibacillus ginsengihumi]|uniref:M67 family metallopeptidase n=1 Tax=Paenibacillus ginsengihumi TaxID=431596 RepID=UPI00037D2072|nr:M67 family metallopeptidase [Paenibacillus ginsengihumi]
MLPRLAIRKEAYVQWLEHCKSLAPEEGCGLLFGSAEGESGWMIERFRPIPNVASEPRTAFCMCPRITTAVLFEEKALGAILVGIAHSHPLAAAVPSSADLRSAWHTVPSQWIVSLASPSEPRARAFRYEGGTFRELPFTIIDYR